MYLCACVYVHVHSHNTYNEFLVLCLVRHLISLCCGIYIEKCRYILKEILYWRWRQRSINNYNISNQINSRNRLRKYQEHKGCLWHTWRNAQEIFLFSKYTWAAVWRTGSKAGWGKHILDTRIVYLEKECCIWWSVVSHCVLSMGYEEVKKGKIKNTEKGRGRCWWTFCRDMPRNWYPFHGGVLCNSDWPPSTAPSIWSF